MAAAMGHAERVRIAKAFAAQAKRAHPGKVRSVLLFGSVARGEDHPESDIDVLVIWDGEHREGLHEMVRVAYPLLLDTGEYVSVKILTPLELERGQAQGNPFVEAVLAEGRPIA
jgi:predicted nucleotidyltransferase